MYDLLFITNIIIVYLFTICIACFPSTRWFFKYSVILCLLFIIVFIVYKLLYFFIN